LRFRREKRVDTVGRVAIFKRVDTHIVVTTGKLRITDLAKATGLSKSTLIRYEEDGKLPKARRDGRKWRFYSEADRDSILTKLKKMELI